MDEKIEFIFVGRLVEEKGFDLVLDMCKKIEQDNNLRQKLHIHIFGDGYLKENILDYSFITYHGFQTKERMFKTRKSCHYSLMPSKFLETFGLSAVDSLSLGVPVIGPDKGGLSQFVMKNYQLHSSTHLEGQLDGEDLFVFIQKLIGEFDINIWREESKKAKEIAKNYTKEKWIGKFQELSGLQPGAKIILVSDYIVDVGGIEHYLWNVKSLLEEYGYIVQIVGCANEEQANNRSKQLLATIWNKKAKDMIENAVQDFQPDLLWRHSVQRRLGWLPLRSQTKFTGKQRVMYHDFGLFHPYPSLVYTERQIKKTSTLHGFLYEGRKGGNGIGLLAKWCSSVILRGLLANYMDLHLVPSPYMKDLIQLHYKEYINLQTLAHFI